MLFTPSVGPSNCAIPPVADRLAAGRLSLHCVSAYLDRPVADLVYLDRVEQLRCAHLWHHSDEPRLDGRLSLRHLGVGRNDDSVIRVERPSLRVVKLEGYAAFGYADR